MEAARHQMALFDPTLFLGCQFPEHLSKMRPESAVQHFSATFGDEHQMIFCTPTPYGSKFRTCPSWFPPFVCLAAHEESLHDGHPFKRQTSTATPAEPGELTWGFSAV